MPDSYRVWRGLGKPKRCRWCRKPIVVHTTDEAKPMAFSATATVLRVDEHPVTRAKFDVLSVADLHRCSKKPRRAKGEAPAAGRIAAQGKLRL